MPHHYNPSHLLQQCSRSSLTLSQTNQLHAQLLTSGRLRSTFLSNLLLKHLPLPSALLFFPSILDPDTISHNTLLSSSSAHNLHFRLLSLFLEMGRRGIAYDRTSASLALKSCSFLSDLRLGTQFHGLSAKLGFDCDVVSATALVDMYGKCGVLECAVGVFEEMPERNSVSWGAVIGACVWNWELWDGLRFLKEMVRVRVEVGQAVYASVLRACAGLGKVGLGKEVHGYAVRRGFGWDTVVGTAVMDVYWKCGCGEEARRVWRMLPMRSVQSCNAMVAGLVRNDWCFEALELVLKMHELGVEFNEVSVSGALSACAGVGRRLEGSQLHGVSFKLGLDLNVSVANAVMDMYGKCRALGEACKVFDEMNVQDAVSWNAVIAAFEQNGNYEESLQCFDEMLTCGMRPDEFTFGSVLKACGALVSLDSGVKIHNRIIKFALGSDSFVGSALVDMYCKCGVMEDAQKLHDRIEKHTNVSWNAMISGFSCQKQSEQSQKFFSEMLSKNVKPDCFTYAAVLETCGNLSTLEIGKQIHAQVIKQKLHEDVFISSTLVDMYAKCGNMEESLLVFEKMQNQDIVSWNSIMLGYAHHGLVEDALRVFKAMLKQNIRPNHATFITVLRACGYMGLFEEGLLYFQSMLQEYGLEPQLEHYSCLVDILGRSGRVHEALKLIEDMAFEPDAIMWRTLLSSCQIHGNMEVAELAATSILQLEPNDSAAYILLSNIYAESGKWGEVSKMRRVMRENKLKKEPGCSWIELKNEVHTFIVADKAHPRYVDIYEKLELLVSEMRRIWCVPDMELQEELVVTSTSHK